MATNSKTHKELAKLLIQAQEGDSEAFSEIYEATVKQQYYIAVKTLKNEVNAEDVTQEVFVYLFEHLKDIRNPVALISYMNKVNYHLCLKMLNKTNQDIELYDDIQISDDRDKKTRETIHNQLESAMFELNTKTREIVVLKYMQEFKTNEIAEYLKVSQRTVQRIIKEGIAEMKNSIKRTTKRQYGLAIFCLPYLTGFINQSAKSTITPEIEVRIFSQIAVDFSMPAATIGVAAASVASSGSTGPVILTKIALGSTVISATIYTGFYFYQPHFKIIEMDNNANYSVVNNYQIEPEFGTNISQITVYDDKMNEYISHRQEGSALISITSNGHYTVQIVDDKNRTAEKKLVVKNIDNICPKVEVSFKNEEVIILINDSESGIDFDALTITNDAGNVPFSIDYDLNEVRFAHDSNVIVSVKDKLGNETIARITK